MTQISIASFNGIGISFAQRNLIFAKVKPKAVIGIKDITVKAFGLRRFIYYFLDDLLRSFPVEIPVKTTASMPVNDCDNMDPVFYLR